MYKKLFFSITFAFVLFMTYTVNASLVYDGGGGSSYSYTKTETWEEWDVWPVDKHYYSADYYKNTTSYYRIYLKNISGTTHWDGGIYSATATVAVTTEKSVSSTTSWSVAGQIGLKVPVKAAEVSGELGGSYSNSKTYTVTNSVTHARTLDRDSPAGYYSLQSAINADEYKVYVYDKETEGASYEYLGYGYTLKYHSPDPYVYFRYTTYQH